MAYEQGAQKMRDQIRELHAQLTSLGQQHKDLTGQIIQARKELTRVEQDHIQAARARTHSSREFNTILTEARTEAAEIIMAAEDQALMIRELAHDQGRAMAERIYYDKRHRENDWKLAKKSVIGHMKEVAAL